MLISVKHKTQYSYEEEAAYTIQSLRLTPRSFVGQNIISWKITAPGRDKALMFSDSFGNQVHTITISEPHNKVVIVAEGTVETQDTNGVVNGLNDIAPSSVFLRGTQMTKASSDIRELAGNSLKDDTLSTLHELNHVILDKVEYERGVTSSKTNASEAFELGKGVCQDHTHIFIAAARTLGIPARYITGYLVSDDEDAEAHHAWAEVYVHNLGWVGFDVSNQLCPTENYVRLSCGLDASDAAPVRGAFQGGEDESLDVSVEVQQQQQTQSQE
ncbi:MAG: transglutaminase family protein [Methyloligellaceae bacterium]